MTDGYDVYWGNGARIPAAEIRATLESGLLERKIVSAESDLEDLDSVSVELYNGVVINFSIKPNLSDAKFAEIKELSLPKTDGQCVYWSNGACLTADEIMAKLSV
jgi:hypothetical protein